NSSANSFYENFTIKMGCTNKNELENEFENDLHTVFLTKNVAVANGINTFTFDNFYDWDGQSNIIVDFCYADTLPVMPDTFLIQAKVINYVAIITASSN